MRAASAWTIGQIGRHTPDHAKAVQVALKAFGNNNDPYLGYRIGTSYENGDGVQKDHAMAVEWMHKVTYIATARDWNDFELGYISQAREWLKKNATK